jgi:hypothetical protein
MPEYALCSKLGARGMREREREIAPLKPEINIRI